MTMNIKKAPLRNGLRDISMEEFWKDPLIVVETVPQKLNELPIDTKKNPSLAKQIGTALELFRAVGMRRYGNISVLATLDLMQAAHYFLWLGDRNPDSQSDGYKDDAEIFQRAFTRHEREIRDFEQWLQTHSY